MKRYNDLQNLPTSVKDIDNINQFFRDVIDLEDNTYWKEALKDAQSSGYSLILHNETPLQRKRRTVQQYLDYKHKVEESKFTLRGQRGDETFDIAYSDNIEKLQRFKDEEQSHNKDINMFIVQENKQLKESNTMITLYHNTTNENAIKINKEGIIPGLRKDVYGKGSEAEGSGVWCSLVRAYGYGGATITFKIDAEDPALEKENDVEYMVFREIKPEEIIDVDLMISNIPCNSLRRDSINSTVESDIPEAIEKWGKDEVLKVFRNNSNSFVKPYTIEQLEHLINTGEKYCKGKIELTESSINTNKRIKNKLLDIIEWYSIEKFYNSYEESDKEKILNIIETKIINNLDLEPNEKEYLKQVIYDYESDINHNHKLSKEFKVFLNKLTESKHKIEEVSRNELLVKSKGETITRYNKAAGYRGFGIVDIDTTSVLTTNSLRVTCRVGDYYDTIELEDILYWIQMYAEQNSTKWQVNTKIVTQALMDAIDGMDIKVDCECADWKYRFAYQATEWGYKYGKPETRPAKITNPSGYGALCKHLISLLGNKRWLQQVTGTFMDWIVKRIDEINRFLRVKEGQELTLPNELARQNAKSAFYSKLFKDKLEEPEEDEEQEEEVEDNVDTEPTEEEEKDFEEIDKEMEEEDNEK